MEKCKFCQTEVTFAGFRLSAEGYQVDTSITDAIHNFPTPASRSDLHSFLGWQTSYPPATVPWHCCWLLCAHCSVQKMILYGHHTMKMLSWRQKGPSLQHQHHLPEQVHTVVHWCKQTRSRFHPPTEVNRWHLDPSPGRFRASCQMPNHDIPPSLS